MTREELTERLHGEARLDVALGRMNGRVYDKKQLRFNEIVQTALDYTDCGSPARVEVAFAGMREAIDACAPTRFDGTPNEMYVEGGSVRSLVQPWMLERA